MYISELIKSVIATDIADVQAQYIQPTDKLTTIRHITQQS